MVASSGEPLNPTFAWYLKTWDVRQLTTDEAYDNNALQARFKLALAKAWAETKDRTGTGRPMDALIGPCAPSASFPHDFPVWWGYYSLWNLLDYPTTIVPLKSFRIDVEVDKKDEQYVPKDNVFDRMNYEVCKLSFLCPRKGHHDEKIKN